MTATPTVALLVGTRKGAFVVTSDERRVDWFVSDIHIPGGDVFHLAYDARDGTLYAAGVFRTDDAGETWEPTNRNVRADFSPDRFPELGQCTHKLLGGAEESGLLYQQNHCGVYRTEDGADSWQDISDGLPSRWGLPLALHPRDPDTLYVLPEDNALGYDVGGGRRYVTDGLFRVFRSRDGGDSWEPLRKGLPDRKVYLHFMREGMTTDGCDPAGVYVGTTSGQVFYSRDEGDNWDLLIDSLPPINSVDAAIVA